MYRYAYVPIDSSRLDTLGKSGTYTALPDPMPIDDMDMSDSDSSSDPSHIPRYLANPKRTEYPESDSSSDATDSNDYEITISCRNAKDKPFTIPVYSAIHRRTDIDRKVVFYKNLQINIAFGWPPKQNTRLFVILSFDGCSNGIPEPDDVGYGYISVVDNHVKQLENSTCCIVCNGNMSEFNFYLIKNRRDPPIQEDQEFYLTIIYDNRYTRHILGNFMIVPRSNHSFNKKGYKNRDLTLKSGSLE